MQYRGGAQYHGDAQYHGGYHDKCGGNILSTVGCSVPWGDIMSTMGGYHEYRGGVQYRGGYHPLKFEYHGGIS